MSVKNLTIMLPEAVLDGLQLLAAERHVSVEQLVRDLLSNAIDERGRRWTLEHEALLNEIGPRTRIAGFNRDEIYANRLD
jgi:plasmid stability protein